jgi:S-layer protein
VAGSSGLTLTAAGMSALKTITVSGAAGLTDSDLNGIGTLTSVTASDSTGANTVSVLQTQTSYAGGSGVDTVTITTPVATKTIDGGAGTADVLIVNGASYAANATKVINFETLKMGAAASGTFDAAGFAHLAAGAITGVSTFSNVAAGVDLTITGAAGAAITATLANATGASDAVSLNVVSTSTAEANSVILNGVETVNVALSEDRTASHLAATETLTLAGTSQSSVVITGTSPAIMALVDTVTTLTSVDASGLTHAGSGFSWTSPATTAAVTVKGSAAGANIVVLSAATVADTYIGGSGADTVTIANALANTLTLGNGANTVNGASTGNNTITGGSGADVFITSTGGKNTVNFGDGANDFTSTSTGVQTYTGGSGVDTVITGAGKDVINAGAGSNLITAGAGADTITVTGSTSKVTQVAGASGTNTSTTIQTSELTSTFDVIFGAAAGFKIDLGNTATITTTLTTAGTNLAASATDDVAVFARGTYDATAGTFTYAANGADTALTYDSAIAPGVTAETIILVGFVSGASTAVAGVITLV